MQMVNKLSVLIWIYLIPLSTSFSQSNVFTLDDAVEAHNKMLHGKGLFGKILMKP